MAKSRSTNPSPLKKNEYCRKVLSSEMRVEICTLDSLLTKLWLYLTLCEFFQ